jgi:hypothetical protein
MACGTYPCLSGNGSAEHRDAWSRPGISSGPAKLLIKHIKCHANHGSRTNHILASCFFSRYFIFGVSFRIDGSDRRHGRRWLPQYIVADLIGRKAIL